MTRSRLLAALCSVVIITPALAVMPEEWKHEQPKDFLAGTLENIVVSSHGEVMLGREVKTLHAFSGEAEVVNALARAGDGRIYAATGPNGRIYQIDGDTVKEFARLPEGGTILSLLFAADGRLLAGTGGGEQAKIYRINGEGKSEVFYEPKGARYIWAMVRGPEGEIYAATGISGELFRIEPDGTDGRVLAKVKPKNLLCLAAGSNGMLYAGTDEDGLVYRFNPADGKAFVMYDAKEAEISSIVIDAGGNLFVATASAEGARPGRSIADKPGGTPDRSETKPATQRTTQPATEGAEKASGKADAGATTKPAATTQPTTRRSVGKTVAKAAETGNAIYRIDVDGFVTEVFREPVMILCLAEENGTLYAGTGNEGRIYAISLADERTTSLAKLESDQATTMLRLDDGRLILGTANEPAIVSISDGRAARGTLTSKALDAEQIVKWGRIRWDASIPEGTKLTVATRSSNVEDVESDAWDEWSDEMDASSPRQIPATPARFLQYRLTFTTTDPQKTPVLRSLTIPYIEENRAPELTSVETIPAREEAQKPTAAPAVKAAVGISGYGGGEKSQAGPHDFWVIKWKAEDPNKDTLEYEVFYRMVGTTRWIKLRSKDPIKETFKLWDTRTVEDGVYEVRVVARDTPSNPKGTALSSARVSDPLVVDNTPPQITIDRAEVSEDGVIVHARIQDARSTIKEVSYAVDSDEDWTPLTADDDIFDSMDESVTFTVSGLSPGEHRIAIRARDDHGNWAYVGRSITVAR